MYTIGQVAKFLDVSRDTLKNDHHRNPSLIPIFLSNTELMI
ncbi:hypothetical protein IG9_00644 [Bacillus cereus HuA2-9]|uniref:HTH merR-type domain-containing protein n=1 Tax=Bacillus cereus HuA2-1 TaxID=1053201 RepID=J9BYL5_BACCE|nr:hypothetical protein IG3_02657 [Bacillus cereus HuA2-1]EOO20461.1 hypothetical protein IG9_00644 [Bacillus cereus HuA2-9]